MRARMITFYIMGPNTKTLINALFVDSTNSIVEKMVVMMRTAIETEEKVGLHKGVFVLSYHSSFEALVCKQE
jgi:GTP-dependent phosphoenolpyruvate carboxykinase